MKRNKFSLSHYKLLTCDMGKLIPLTFFEVLPGDSIQQATAALVRVSPLLAPVMHPVDVRIHHWYVPFRLIWEDFEEFITGGPDGTSVPVVPYKNLQWDWSTYESTLIDYLGIPPVDYTGGFGNYNILPFRAYNTIWNENYRDQDLETEVTVSLSSGADGTTVTALKNVSWKKDYFTTSRPWESKGDEVTIPLVGDAPVKGIGWYDQVVGGSTTVYETGETASTTFASQQSTGAGKYVVTEEDPSNSGFPNIRADLSAVSGVSINDLRLALALQRYQEARAQYGSRYVEYLRYLGVRSSDARLQNPEYLGGGKQTIQFSEVLATDGANTGEMYGHGISAMRTNRYRRFFEEHGLVMTLMSVVPKSIYADGLHRFYSKTVKEDWFQKELQHIGEQEIYNRELKSDHASYGDSFGYQMRYDEYRSHPSSIAGEFRSTLDHWHLARIFASDPALNSTFVSCSPTKRMLASSSTDALYVMANHSIQARRMLSKKAKNLTF